MRFFRCLAAGALVVGCGNSAPISVSATVSPEGGVLRTSNGIVLDIPQGALSSTTTITVTQLGREQLNAESLVGVTLEPHGLHFLKPVQLTLPLSKELEREQSLVEYEWKLASDEAYATGEVATISPDRKQASLKLTHFSGKICAENCHAGTREFLMSTFLSRGCGRSAIERRVQGSFPQVTLPTSCASLDGTRVQAILDTFFDDIGGYDEGTAVDSATLSALAGYVAAGRNVVLAFKRGTFGSRGSDGFYSGVAHTAAIEMRGGIAQIRNSVVAGTRVLAALRGTNLVYWPLSDLNGFRLAKQGVGVEMQACGAPGCLGPEDADPMDPQYPYNPLSQRIVPWSAVRIYVEKLPLFSCAEDAGASTDSGVTNDAKACEVPKTVSACCEGNSANCKPSPCPEGFCWMEYGHCRMATCPANGRVARYYSCLTCPNNDHCVCNDGFTPVFDYCSVNEWQKTQPKYTETDDKILECQPTK